MVLPKPTYRGQKRVADPVTHGDSSAQDRMSAESVSSTKRPWHNPKASIAKVAAKRVRSRNSNVRKPCKSAIATITNKDVEVMQATSVDSSEESALDLSACTSVDAIGQKVDYQKG